MKPFCSGGTADVEILHALQDGELARDEINPFYFSEPIAPLLAARKHHRHIPLRDVLKTVTRVAQRDKAATEVAQVSNLLYRRFPIGRPSKTPNPRVHSGASQAGSTAIQQVGNLRYDANRISIAVHR